MLKAGIAIREQVIELFEARTLNALGDITHMQRPDTKFPITISWSVVAHDCDCSMAAHA